MAVTITGDYRRATWRDVPRAAWISSRAFATIYPTALPPWAWTALTLPATLLEFVMFKAVCDVFVRPSRGRVQAIQPVQLAHATHRRVAALSGIATGFLVMVLLSVPITMIVIGLGWSPKVLVVGAAALVVEMLVARAGLQRWLSTRPIGIPGGSKPKEGLVELTTLSAWPRRRGNGPRLFHDVVTDLVDSLPAGTVLVLEPATARGIEEYAKSGFRTAPGTHWMTLTTQKPALIRSLPGEPW